jgi:hypothetical protein
MNLLTLVLGGAPSCWLQSEERRACRGCHVGNTERDLQLVESRDDDESKATNDESSSAAAACGFDRVWLFPFLFF